MNEPESSNGLLRRYNLHLSTTIVVTVTTGALLWANVVATDGMNLIQQELVKLYGWPLTCLVQSSNGVSNQWYISAIVTNLILNFALLFCVSYICELSHGKSHSYFILHRLSCTVFAFTATQLIVANFIPRHFTSSGVQFLQFGWPFPAAIRFWKPGASVSTPPTYNSTSLLLNDAIATAIVIGLTSLVEILLRRRERPKAVTAPH